MDNVKCNKRDIIYRILVIVFFLILANIVAYFHEPWSDEAQSFLLARDNSLWEIIYYSKLEGTLPLWFIIIKIFLLLGGNYETYYILPIFFTTIGLIIFEFKINAPRIIKILLPFTFFIFYQYTIIARSYCLVFPCLMFICAIYNKRHEKPILYCLALFIFMNISSHTLLIAGSLFLIEWIDLIRDLFLKNKILKIKGLKNKLKSLNNVKIDNKLVIFLIIIFAELLFSFFMIIPDESCSFSGNGGKSLWYIIYHATIGNTLNPNNIFAILIICIFLMIILYAIRNEVYKKYIILKALILLIPVLLLNIFLHCAIWHIGIITILIFTIFILNNLINRNEIIKMFLIIICIVQVSWTCYSIMYDVVYNYSGSKDVANFLKENDYENKTIYGLGYDITAILPYFENNIFKNQHSDKSFWIWSKLNGYTQKDNLLQEEVDIYVISELYSYEYKNLIKKLKNKNYKQYNFEGYLYAKTFICESKGYMVFIRE